MNNKQASLEEILNNNTTFIDSSIINPGSTIKKIYEATSFNNLDSSLIISERNKIIGSIEIIKNQKVKVIPQVVEEIKEYQRILGDKISYISHLDRGRFYRNKNKRHISKWFIKNNKNNSINKKLLGDLQQDAYLLYQLCSRKKFEISDKKFELLLEMIKLLDNKIGLKKDISYVYGDHNIPDTSSDTDERLVASLYWNSLYSNNSASLLTTDTDFIRLLGVTPTLLGSYQFFPYNEYFRNRLSKNPFKLYIFTNNEYSEKTFHPFNFNHDFLIYKIPKNENSEVRERISFLWKEFSEN